MLNIYRKDSLKSKISSKTPCNGNSQEKQKRKRKKRKSIVFKPDKRAKRQNYSNDDISDITVSVDERKTIISDGKSDFDNAIYDQTSDLDRNVSYSGSLLDEFLKDSSDEKCSDEGILLTKDNVEPLNSKTSFMSEDQNTEEDSNDSIESALNELIKKSQIEEEYDSDISDAGHELYECDTDYIVILKYSQSIRIFGYCDLKVLHGKINILGYSLNSTMPKQSIYSPKGTALLTIKNTSNYCDETRKMKSLVPKLSNHPVLKGVEVRKDSSVLLLVKKHDTILNFIEEHVSQWILPKKTSFPCIEINPKGSWNSITIPTNWNEIIQNTTAQSKILVCGGKGVGKSTFLRYTVNCLLQKYKRVKVIDLDPGQSEFNVPSTISVVTVLEPLLGVNYTHLKTAERSILSEINIAPNPDKFIEGLEEITNEDIYEENVPTVINTMGFTNDIAFHLIASTVALLVPNQIVYIESGNKKKNFKKEFNRETLIEGSKFFTPRSKFDFRMDIQKISSETDENVGWTLQPRQMREMCILAYFGQSIKENYCNTLHDHRLPMFEVDLLDVSITDKNNKNVPVEAINANIVALCRLSNEFDAIFECFGWGIVRSHNPSTRKIILITPANKDDLEKVTHLVVGCLTLPPSVYMNQQGVVGHIPYIMTSDLKGFDQMSKRSRIPFDAEKK